MFILATWLLEILNYICGFCSNEQHCSSLSKEYNWWVTTSTYLQSGRKHKIVFRAAEPSYFSSSNVHGFLLLYLWQQLWLLDIF